MKIGIVTLTASNDFNFGNTLQSYALQFFLRKLGHEPETFLSRPFCLHGYEHINIFQVLWCGFSLKTLKTWGHFLLHFKYNWKTLKGEMKKQDVFHEFEKNYIVYAKERLNSRVEENCKLANMYDYFIVGSDQIWQSPSGNAFLQFANDGQRIAYAPSFGEVSKTEKECLKYAFLMRGMKCLSVREEAGREFICKITGKTAEVLVDPTMLVTKEEWSKVSKKPCIAQERYVLTYFLSEIPMGIWAQIDKYAQNENIEIVNIWDIKQTIGPAEFLYLMSHAELVFTNSFHGTVFSIIFNVPFVVCDENINVVYGQSSRMDTLLQRFSLESRRFSQAMMGQDGLLKVDFSNVNDILSQERSRAKIYLQTAMGGDIA